MKFQNCILINFELTHGRTDGRTYGQAKSNMPLQPDIINDVKLFQTAAYRSNTVSIFLSYPIRRRVTKASA